MSKFKVGDRVRIVKSFTCTPSPMDGKIGTLTGISTIPNSSYPYLVTLDDGGTDCAHQIEHLKYPVIVITTDGVTTTATKRLGKKVLGTAYSKCAPADTFDYDTGVGLALARLCGFEIKFHEEEPQPPKKYTHKVVCVESVTKWWTVGKIYECKDGVLQDDSGLNRDRSICTFPKDIDELNSTWWDTPNGREARFIELVED